jgi:hypothetical protein
MGLLFSFRLPSSFSSPALARCVSHFVMPAPHYLVFVCVCVSWFCCPDFPFSFPRVVAFHDQLGVTPREILEKQFTAWSRYCLSNPHNRTNLIIIPALIRKSMTNGLSLKLPQSGHSLCSCSPGCHGSCVSIFCLALNDRC